MPNFPASIRPSRSSPDSRPTIGISVPTSMSQIGRGEPFATVNAVRLPAANASALSCGSRTPAISGS